MLPRAMNISSSDLSCIQEKEELTLHVPALASQKASFPEFFLPPRASKAEYTGFLETKPFGSSSAAKSGELLLRSGSTRIQQWSAEKLTLLTSFLPFSFLIIYSLSTLPTLLLFPPGTSKMFNFMHHSVGDLPLKASFSKPQLVCIFYSESCTRDTDIYCKYTKLSSNKYM